MSDIIYTPPAASGGTTINPTNNFIPKRSNATTFVDSVLRTTGNNNNDLGTFVGGNYNGFYLDFTNRAYQFGNVNANNQTKLVINDGAQFIATANLNELKGLYFEYTTQRYYLGDWNNYNQGTSIAIDDATQNIYTLNNGIAIGLNLDFLNNTYSFGISGSSNFYIDANNQYAQITLASIQYMALDQLNGIYSFGDYAGGMGLEWDNGNNEFVLKQQGLEYIVVGNSTAYFGQRVNFSYKIDYNTSILSIGDNGGVIAGSLFVLDLNQDIICTQTQGNRKGLLLDFANTEYKFGDFNGVNKGNYIYIEDANNTIHFYALNLDFVGGNLQSGSAGGSSGQHLVLTLNGIQYKIQLLNP